MHQELLRKQDMGANIPVDETVPRLSRMSERQCREELLADLDLETLRALVGAKRALRKAQRTQFTGRIEADCQAGRVRRWRIPDSIELFD